MSETAERLLDEALALDAADRMAFVEHASRGDSALREELVSLLREASEADDFFDRLSEAVFTSSYSSGDEQDTNTPEESEPAQGDIIGHYSIVSRVGSGGMGTVYRAHDTRLDRDVALKFLAPSLSAEPDARERLLSEARAAAALDHPNVCSIHEIGETPDGHLFITMPFYEGEPLKERLRRSAMSAEESVATITQIARGLAAAHARGVIHRDVKPGNVMLLRDGTLRLLDFGLAMVIDPNETRSGSTRGTVAYMSPEQVRGEALDARTDLWSLGVVLYEMLAGVRPFRGQNGHAILQAILNKDPEPLSILRPGISRRLSDIVERLLQRDPAKRYDSAAKVAEELEHADSGASTAPVSAEKQPANRHYVRNASLALAATLIVIVGAWLGSARNFPAPHPAQHESAVARGNIALAHERMTESIAAYDLYVRGMDPVFMRTDSAARTSLRILEQAVALDPGYANAYAGISRVHLRLANGDDAGVLRRDRIILAERAAAKAVSLDGFSAEAHTALAKAKKFRYDMRGAEAEAERAIELAPGNPEPREALSVLHLLTGTTSEALADARRALDLDPLSATATVEYAGILAAADRCDEALSQLAKLKSLSPPLNRAGMTAAECHARRRMWPEAIAEIERIRANGGPRAEALLAYMLARSGRAGEARGILGDLITRSQRIKGDAFYAGIVYAGLGDKDRAFMWLDRSVDDLSFVPEWLPLISNDLRGDRRLERISRRAGVTSPELW